MFAERAVGTLLITGRACDEHTTEREWQIVDRRRAG